nr:nuclear RNA export factor 3 isoform X1 [Microcebus murinus]
MGHNHQVNSVQRRARCWGIYRRRFPNWAEPVSPSMHPSSRHQQDGDATASDIHMDSGVRYTPYAIPPYHRRGTFHKQDKTLANMEREQKSLERSIQGRRLDRTSGSWFKITVPFGIKYDEKWLLNLIQSQCSVPFTPFKFHYEKMQAHFFVENATIAFALKNVSGNIWDQDNERISIFVSPSDVPHFVHKEPKSEKVQQVKLTMKKRDDSQETLDIQKLQFDPDFMRHPEMAATPSKYMAASLGVHEENVTKLVPLNPSNSKPYQLPDTVPKAPNINSLNLSKTEVESAGEMDKEKGLEPQQMLAGGNAPCTTLPDKSGNINSILELFPKLLRLDGQESPRPTLGGTEAHKKLPTSKGSVFGSETLKNLVLQFLQQYYLIYDSGDRQSLLDAYHEEACFSLTIPFNPEDPASSSLCEYFKESRNLKMLKDPYLQRQLLKHTKRDIVDTLSELPKTQHDLSSFLVDVWFQAERMLCFSVSGVFKEVEGKSQGCVRAFARIFITVPTSNSSLCIINDELFIRDTGPQGIWSAFPIPMITPYSSSVAALSQEQQKMVQAFSAQFGMNLEWSQKCLHDNQWDYIRAAEVPGLPKVTPGNSGQDKSKTPEEAQPGTSTN